MILLDTNVLLRYVEPTNRAYPITTAAIAALHAVGEALAVVPQNFDEFWAAATRSLTANGLGLSGPECQSRLQAFRQLFVFLPDQPTLFAAWESLVTTFHCHGRVSYDARLVAAMQTHGLTRILTFNPTDFTRYSGLIILDPAAVVTSAPPIAP